MVLYVCHLTNLTGEECWKSPLVIIDIEVVLLDYSNLRILYKANFLECSF